MSNGFIEYYGISFQIEDISEVAMNRKIISNWAKKNFLFWFVENYQQQSPGSQQILLQLAGNESLLSQVHIVLDGSYLRPLLVVSTDATGMPPFLLKTFDSTVTDCSMILTRLPLLMESPIYLTLYFPDRASCEPHQAVVEEDPISLDSTRARQILIDFELSLWSASFKREMERAELLNQIDQALDEKNKRKFRSLVKKLNSL
jgi:uncharacterized protein YpiB (UPF0302 family)